MTEKAQVVTMSLAKGIRRAQARQALETIANETWTVPAQIRTKKELLVGFEKAQIDAFGADFVKRIFLDKNKGADWLISAPVVAVGLHAFHLLSLRPPFRTAQPQAVYYPAFLTDHCMERLIAASRSLGVRPISAVHELLSALEGDYETTLVGGKKLVAWSLSGAVDIATSRFLFHADFHDSEMLLVRTAIASETLDPRKFELWRSLRASERPRSASPR